MYWRDRGADIFGKDNLANKLTLIVMLSALTSQVSAQSIFKSDQEAKENGCYLHIYEVRGWSNKGLWHLEVQTATKGYQINKGQKTSKASCATTRQKTIIFREEFSSLGEYEKTLQVWQAHQMRNNYVLTKKKLGGKKQHYFLPRKKP